MADQLHLWDEPRDGLRWSVSKHQRRRDCARRYYLHDIRARGGHHEDAPPEVREAFILRNLHTRYSWVGDVVHELIELTLAAFRRNEDVRVDEVVERGTRRMRAQWANSVQRVYRERPAAAFGLWEHEYGAEVSRDEWRGQRDNMEACVRRFFELELLTKIRAAPRYRWLAVESLGSFEVDGATVVVRPDFALRDDDQRVVLIDWKTGQPRPEAERLQLGVYGVYAKKAWGLGPGDILGRVAHLKTGEVSELRLEAADLDAAEALVRASVKDLRELAGQPIEAFGLTEDLSRCTFCPFRRLCGR